MAEVNFITVNATLPTCITGLIQTQENRRTEVKNKKNDTQTKVSKAGDVIGTREYVGKGYGCKKCGGEVNLWTDKLNTKTIKPVNQALVIINSTKKAGHLPKGPWDIYFDGRKISFVPAKKPFPHLCHVT